MYSIICSHISYGNMLCFKVFLNIYAELFGGGGGCILNDSQKCCAHLYMMTTGQSYAPKDHSNPS